MSENDELAGRMARMDVARLRGVLPPDELVVPMPPVAPPRPAGIPWVPIADMPEAWKDGRRILAMCNDEYPGTAGRIFEVSHIRMGGADFGWDLFPGFAGVDTSLFTHVAAINRPDEVAAPCSEP